MALFSVYTDVEDFLANAASSIETASLIGGRGQLASSVSLGAVSLPLLSGQAATFPASGTFIAYVLDGPNSEQVIASVSGANLAVPAGTLAAHGALVSVSSAGTMGCLADAIAQASAQVEYVCAQGPDGGERGLWQQSRTETLAGPTLYRAQISADMTLRLRPYHFPVTSVASVSLAFGADTASALSLTALTLPDGARSIEIPQVTALQQGNPPQTVYFGNLLPRNLPFYVTLSYTGGPVAGTTLSSVPYALKTATFYYVIDRLAFRSNPLGVVNMRRGDINWSYAGHGMKQVESLLAMRAQELLVPYMAQPGW